jgi:hypothetical protein
MEQTGKEEEEIDRVECWKKARENKKGGFDPAVQKVLDKIVCYVKLFDVQLAAFKLYVCLIRRC